jgi:acetylornithine deacetylase/succinyl-diaminopimelate desuccinylase-like protein
MSRERDGRSSEISEVPEVTEVADAIAPHLDVEMAVELTRAVCRIPSILGDEGEVAGFLASTMRELGFEGSALQPVLPDRPNAVAEVSFGPGRRVVLTGHMDTKPVSHGWTVTDPFSGDLVDGRVYGHGIMDMKSALVCQIVALHALARTGLPLAGTAAMSAVSDHMGDQRGSIAYFDQYPADLCVLGELSDNEIYLGHRGRYYFDVIAHGRSAHTCHKPLAVNANYLAALVLLELERSALHPELDPDVADLFGKETYISPGRIYGGLPPGGPSMIPDECVIRVDCRPQPGVSVDTVRAEIDRCIAAARDQDDRVSATVLLADEKSGYWVDPESEVVRLMCRAVAHVKGVDDPPLRAAGWLGDTASFGNKVPTVIFGPGREPVYCADENLSVDDIHLATQVYALFTALALMS